jgi:hypothetical protein
MQQARTCEEEQAVEVVQNHADGTRGAPGWCAAEARPFGDWREWTLRSSPGGGAVDGRIPREAKPRGRFQRVNEVSKVEAKATKVGCRFYRIVSARAVQKTLEDAPGDG